eukprot:CAMPEP_0198549230 /NCGR_PEP_ID=MMETSP1462-20131121/72263_1 /TAXON_ID=1333877 /ORGANISM="Brandtodinium nutriculum, Strain RCC3387" /LENGTH=45 /DNA_ID= /DNA_START= /DNA_END= /DNA_ORIENTATION=
MSGGQGPASNAAAMFDILRCISGALWLLVLSVVHSVVTSSCFNSR